MKEKHWVGFAWALTGATLVVGAVQTERTGGRYGVAQANAPANAPAGSMNTGAQAPAGSMNTSPTTPQQPAAGTILNNNLPQQSASNLNTNPAQRPAGMPATGATPRGIATPGATSVPGAIATPIGPANRFGTTGVSPGLNQVQPRPTGVVPTNVAPPAGSPAGTPYGQPAR